MGRLWRAKEILTGRVGSAPFNAPLYEQLGQVLLRMGDDLQAGRFLFLSGVRRPEYKPAIELYSRRYLTKARHDLLATFPQPCAVGPGRRCRQPFETS